MAALASDRRLHPSWLHVVFARFFQHQNTVVIKYGLEAFLTAEVVARDLDNGDDDATLLADFLVSQLFRVLNETRIYSVSDDGKHYGEKIR